MDKPVQQEIETATYFQALFKMAEVTDLIYHHLIDSVVKNRREPILLLLETQSFQLQAVTPHLKRDL